MEAGEMVRPAKRLGLRLPLRGADRREVIPGRGGTRGRENVRDREIGGGEVSPPYTRESRSAPRFEAVCFVHPPILHLPPLGKGLGWLAGCWSGGLDRSRGKVTMI
jgi:hypothetical protein